MANYTLTFEPQEGYVSELSQIIVGCDEGMQSVGSLVAGRGNTAPITNEDGDTIAYVVFNTQDCEVVTMGDLIVSVTMVIRSASNENITITDEGTYTAHFPDNEFTFADGTTSEAFTLTYIIGEEPKYSLPLTDLDGLVTGSAYVVPTEGSGDGAVSVTADEGNEGLDRSGVVTFSTTGGEVSVARTIVQLGLREPFAASDGDFLVADGGTYHVLKEENK